MKCPQCGLINPMTAMTCDCGYNFVSGHTKQSYVNQLAKTAMQTTHISLPNREGAKVKFESVTNHRPYLRDQKDLRLKETASVITYLEKPYYLNEHAKFVNTLKENRMLGNMGNAIGTVIIGGLAIVYGIADIFGNIVLPLGVPALFLGVFLLIKGIVGVFRVFPRFAKQPTTTQPETAASIKDLCTKFYQEVFCEKGTGEAKENQIINVSHFFPIPVLKTYQTKGWSVFEGSSTPTRRGSNLLECVYCQKRTPYSIPSYQTIPIQISDMSRKGSDEIKRSFDVLYLKCGCCNNVLCHSCMCRLQSEESRYLCPFCGKTTNGWSGLARRWEFCRRSITDQDARFELLELDIEENPHSDPRVVEIDVHLSGKPFGQVTFSNVLLKIGGNLFLLSPEPERNRKRTTDIKD